MSSLCLASPDFVLSGDAPSVPLYAYAWTAIMSADSTAVGVMKYAAMRSRSRAIGTASGVRTFAPGRSATVGTCMVFALQGWPGTARPVRMQAASEDIRANCSFVPSHDALLDSRRRVNSFHIPKDVTGANCSGSGRRPSSPSARTPARWPPSWGTRRRCTRAGRFRRFRATASFLSLAVDDDALAWAIFVLRTGRGISE